jgi:hypothetical protein
LRVTLVGTDSDRSALGARLVAHLVEGGKPRAVHRDVSSGGSFGSNSLTQHLGLGQATRVERLEVRWPRSGKVQVFRDLPADRHVRLTEGQDALEVVVERPTPFGN